ncbi:MAG: SLBB domain-containing protein [Microcoleaceae cyanobacterium]
MIHLNSYPCLFSISRRSWSCLTLVIALTFTPNSSCLAQSSIPQTATISQTHSPYALGSGDRIAINILDFPELAGEYLIPPTGIVDFPWIGRVQVLGKTIEQLGGEIEQKYRRFIKRPQITLNVMNYRPLNVMILGEVSRPGSYTVDLKEGAGVNTPGIQFPTIMQAIELAGGITQDAKLDQVLVRRPLPEGKEQVITLNIWEMLRTGLGAQNLTLRDGDTIFIPTQTEISLAEARQIATATGSIAPNPDLPRTVAVVGAVQRPGSYVVKGGGITESSEPFRDTEGYPSLTRVIQLAGGITPMADIRNIQVRRQTQTFSEQVIQINLWELLQSGDISQDLIMQEGDTIVVPEVAQINTEEITEMANANFAPNQIEVNVVGEVKQPGVVAVRPNTSLNQAVLAAGGFDEIRAKKTNVDLIRLNPDGTVSTRTINVDFSQQINADSNPLLQSNDIIVVHRSGLTEFTDSFKELLIPANAVLSTFTIPLRVVDILKRAGVAFDEDD